MGGAARAGVDSAGGTISAGSPDVIVNGSPIARIGDPVSGHGDSPHASPTMSAGSGDVIANGIGVCRSGDAASCGDAASGSGDVIVN